MLGVIAVFVPWIPLPPLASGAASQLLRIVFLNTWIKIYRITKEKILKNSWIKPQWPVGDIRHLNTCNWCSKWKIETENWTENIFKAVMTKNFPTTVKTSAYKSWEYRKNIYKQSKCKEITYPGHYKETAQKQRYTEYIFFWKDSLDCVYCRIWV